MNKNAIRLGIFVLLMVLGVIFFIWNRSKQAPALFGLIPQEVEQFALVDMRNVMKKAYRFGMQEEREVLPDFPLFILELFAPIATLNEPGINLFSEWVWFAHPKDFECIFVKLANTEKWDAFMEKHVQEGGAIQFEPMVTREEDDLMYWKGIDRGLSVARRGKHLAMVYAPNNDFVPGIQDMLTVLKPSAYTTVPKEVFYNLKPDVVFCDLILGNSFALNVLPDKLRFQFQQAHKPGSGKPIPQSFFLTPTVTSKSHVRDTSELYVTARFVSDFTQSLASLPELFSLFKKLPKGMDGMGLGVQLYASENDTSLQTRVEPFLTQVSFPTSFSCDHSDKQMVMAADLQKHISNSYTRGFWGLSETYLPDRLYMTACLDSQHYTLAGTAFYAFNNKLPLYPTLDFILDYFVSKKIPNLSLPQERVP